MNIIQAIKKAREEGKDYITREVFGTRERVNITNNNRTLWIETIDETYSDTLTLLDILAEDWKVV